MATRVLYEDVGRCIRQARNAAGLSLSEMSKRLGCTPTHLQRVELADTACALHLLVAIADELDTTLDDLCPVQMTDRETY